MGRAEGIWGPALAGLALWAGVGSCGNSGSGGERGADGDDGIASLSTGDSTGIASVGDDDDGPKLDVSDGATGGGPGDCNGGGMGGDYEFSYIWIANSPEGTVSKINTFTGVEEGRYRTGPMDDPDPSRTSVNQFGDVAIADRNGGIAKVAARVESCVDNDGSGTIETSTGPADVLAWGEDECVLWFQPLPAAGDPGPRPVAWEPVESCSGLQPRVWVGHYTDTDQDIGVFYRLDGTTGATLDMVEVELWDYGTNPRPYGGAVNADGDLWVTGYYGPAIRIDAVTLEVEYFAPPDGAGFYGMALDADENMWIGGCDGAIWHLDRTNNTISSIADIDGRARGVQVDREGRAWFAGNDPCRLLMVDVASKQLVEPNIPLPGCSMPVGVSIDVEGYVWVVDMQAEVAFKVDPDDYSIALTVSGLVQPYTYSDMTGAGLGLLANPPTG